MTRPVHVFRLDVTYPEGSRGPGWEPPGWVDYVVTNGPDGGALENAEFRWPAERMFLSRSGANQRAKLLRGYGAKVTLVPSLPVEWPAPGGA